MACIIRIDAYLFQHKIESSIEGPPGIVLSIGSTPQSVRFGDVSARLSPEWENQYTIIAHRRVVLTTDRNGKARVRPGILFIVCDMLLSA